MAINELESQCPLQRSAAEFYTTRGTFGNNTTIDEGEKVAILSAYETDFDPDRARLRGEESMHRLFQRQGMVPGLVDSPFGYQTLEGVDFTKPPEQIWFQGPRRDKMTKKHGAREKVALARAERRRLMQQSAQR
jgi:hypothetical protein